MPFNGSGGFNRVRKWVNDAAGAIKIRADFHDTEDDGFAAGLSQCITKNGETQPSGNLPLNGKRWVNAGDPVDPQDYATRHWVEVLPGWTTSKNISGADADGRLNFTATTGVNGIGWTGADLSWLAKLGEANKTLNRLVLNDKVDGSGGDVFVIDEQGRINGPGTFTNNLSWDGVKWRTIAPGTGTQLQVSGSTVQALSNDTATVDFPYLEATQRQFWSVANSGGSAVTALNNSGSTKASSIYGTSNGVLRWNMQMGNGVAESGSNAGSDFSLHRYDDGGGYLGQALGIVRSTGVATFGGAVIGNSNITALGEVVSGQTFRSSSLNVILAASNTGAIFLRPNGPNSPTEQVQITKEGDLVMSTIGGVWAGYGLKSKAGTAAGAYTANWINFQWVAGAGGGLRGWVDTVNLGLVSFTCDYRLKTDIAPLASVWDKVKALRPVKFRWGDYQSGETVLSVASDDEQWGFLAHELQETLLPSAASGKKDEENVIQSPNVMAVIAALTNALQEAMVRIEALEARA